MSRHKQMQIEQAARGCISGTLVEWPHLQDALGNAYPMTTNARDLRTICIERLSRSVTSGEHFRVVDPEYGGAEIWWTEQMEYETIANWIGIGATEISILQDVNGAESRGVEGEPYWREVEVICPETVKGFLRVRGIEYPAVRYVNACPVGYYIATEFLDDLQSV